MPKPGWILGLIVCLVLSSPLLGWAAEGEWTATGGLNAVRRSATATLLPNGKVLIAGGWGAGGFLATAELYDPATRSFTPTTGGLTGARSYATATRLPNGKVLIVGGYGPPAYSYLTSAELYDPTTGSFTATGGLAEARWGHTATLLPNGKVLIAGGYGSAGTCGSAELYDPATGTFSPTGSLVGPRVEATATLLPSGKVLLAGGAGVNGAPIASAELYDPAANGGVGGFTATGSPGTARYAATATLLPSGKVLLAGGVGTDGVAVASTELYDPAAASFTATGALGQARERATATLLPSGKVLVAGGAWATDSPLASAELYCPEMPGTPGAFAATGGLAAARGAASATLLPTGKVLIVGGWGVTGSGLASAEVYDPAANGGAGAFTPTGALTQGVAWATATLLPTGKVLVTGWGRAELYDPAANGSVGGFTATGAPGTYRYAATATLLPSGKVLIAGGEEVPTALASAELYDPAANGSVGGFTATGAPGTARENATATLLPNGKVLIAGGWDGSTALASAELYDPAANGGVGGFTATGALATARAGATATLLPTGKVLIVGGEDASTVLASAELYDPAANGSVGAFTATGALATARAGATATLLPTGTVLLAAGAWTGGWLASAEVYATSICPTCTLTVTPGGSGNGTVSAAGGLACPGTCTADYEMGSQVTLTAAATAGSTFAGWGEGACAEATGETCTLTLDTSTTVHATFTRITYVLTMTVGGSSTGTVASSPEGINGCSGTCSASVGSGMLNLYVVVSDPGGIFREWRGVACSGGNASPMCLFTMDGPKTVRAIFSKTYADPSLTPGDPVKAGDFAELRDAINTLRSHHTPAPLPPFTWTAPAPAVGGPVRVTHLTDLRTALNGIQAQTYAEPTITARTTPIKASHVSELRTFVRNLE